MKKSIIFTIWLVLALVLSFSPTVSADVIIPPPLDSHHLDWCIKFVNLNEFPAIKLLANYPYRLGGKGPPGPTYYETYQIENNRCITEGATYPIGRLRIYWWYVGDKANTIDYNNDVWGDFGLDGGYVPNSNPLVKETFEYSLAGFSNGRLIIYKSRHISEYNDGSPAKVENLNNPWANLVLSPTPPPQPVPNPAPTLVPPTTQVPRELLSPPTNSTAPPPLPGLLVTPPSSQPDLLPEPAGRGFWQFTWPNFVQYEQKFLVALLLTLVIEIPVAILLIKTLYKYRGNKISKVIQVGFVASTLTLPYFWLVFPIFVSNRNLYIFSGEFLIFVIEAIIYNRFLKLKLSEASVVSLVANAASIIGGLALI